MNKNRKSILKINFSVFLLAILISGCVSTNATLLGPSNSSRPETNPKEIIMYRTADQVPGKYQEIALLHSKGDSLYTDEADMYESMRKKAAEVGANAIILDAISEPSAGAKVAGAFLGTGSDRKGSAVAIFVYPSEDNLDF